MAMNLLASAADQFGGVIVDPEQLPATASEFFVLLERSFKTWRADGKRLVWLGVPLAHAALIPVAVDAGFVFHHSNEGDLMMVCRLVEDAFVPTHATHYIGVMTTDGVMTAAFGSLVCSMMWPEKRVRPT